MLVNDLTSLSQRWTTCMHTVGGDVNVKKPTAPPVASKYRTRSSEQCTILGDDNKWLGRLLVCVLAIYYTFSRYFRVHSYLEEKVYRRQPPVSCFLCCLIASFFPVFNLILCCFVHHSPNHTKPTANVARKRPPWVTDLETKLMVIKNYETRK
jgi:hypothetical protein